MARVSAELISRHFGTWEHPYRSFEKLVDSNLGRGATLVDVGCGRTAPVLRKYSGKGLTLIGIDCVEFSEAIPGIELHNADICRSGLGDEVANVVMARSVMEHVREPEHALSEIRRILKPSGCFIFLTANRWDYASMLARLVPNRLHPWLVRATEGREEEDVFPTAYRCNSRGQISSLAQKAGFEIRSFEYLGQYPNYLLFNRWAFLAGTAYEKAIARYESLHWLRGWLLVCLQKK